MWLLHTWVLKLGYVTDNYSVDLIDCTYVHNKKITHIYIHIWSVLRSLFQMFKHVVFFIRAIFKSPVPPKNIQVIIAIHTYCKLLHLHFIAILHKIWHWECMKYYSVWFIHSLICSLTGSVGRKIYLTEWVRKLFWNAM